MDIKEEHNEFFHELDGRGFIFQNKKWLGGCFEDDQLQVVWEMWQAKAQAVPNLRDLQERIGGHQYYHDEHGHMIVDMDDVVKEISGFDGWKAQAVPEGFVLVPKDQYESLNEFKGLYKRAIINARKRKDQLNWAHVAGLGVSSGRAVELCKMLNIDPSATNMHEVIEAQEQSHD